MHWYVIKTKPKKEEAVKKQLAGVRLELFLPRIKGLTSDKPLFPSYLFVRTDFDDSYVHRLVRYTRGVHKILGGNDGPQPISDAIVETLQDKTKDGSLIEQELLFKKGDEVRVKKGILKDLIGIIEKNISDVGRVSILFKWLQGNMKAMLKYTELERVP